MTRLKTKLWPTVLVPILLCFGAALPNTTSLAGDDKASEGLSPADEEAVRHIIREYLLENPEVIAEAIMILQERDEAARQSQQADAVRANHDKLVNDGVSVILGNPKGDVTLVEFYDYQCPYCRRGHADVLRLIDSDANLRVVYKQLPIKDVPGAEPGSLIAARMAMAADRQGLFRAFHAEVMRTPMPLTEAKLTDAAQRVGLDLRRLRLDMQDKAITNSIRDNMFMARDIGITGTPTYVIGEHVIVGALGFEALQEAVSVQRQAGSGNTDSP